MSDSLLLTLSWPQCKGMNKLNAYNDLRDLSAGVEEGF